MVLLLFLAGLVCAMSNVSFAQNTPDNTSTAACSFQDGKQISVRHTSTEVKGTKDALPEGRLWMPGGAPMFLFASTELTVGNGDVPVGAYSMYVIPGKDSWTLVLNKNVSDASKYDQHEDLLRVPMEMGRLSSPEHFNVSFGHVAPKQCNMRIYYGKAGVWAEFKEK